MMMTDQGASNDRPLDPRRSWDQRESAGEYWGARSQQQGQPRIKSAGNSQVYSVGDVTESFAYGPP
jgi:hypothetical protein